MVKIFISYKYTGEDLTKVWAAINKLTTTIHRTGNIYFCNLYSDDMYIKEHYTTKQIMDHCVENLKTCDIYLAYVTGDFAGGMAIECGYAYSLGMKIVACLPNNKETYTSLKGISTHVLTYEDLDDLCVKLDDAIRHFL